jgi:hypothetical protein
MTTILSAASTSVTDSRGPRPGFWIQAGSTRKTDQRAAVMTAIKHAMKDSAIYAVGSALVAAGIPLWGCLGALPTSLPERWWAMANQLTGSWEPSGTLGWIVTSGITIFLATQIGQALSARRDGLPRLVTVFVLLMPIQFFLLTMAWLAVPASAVANGNRVLNLTQSLGAVIVLSLLTGLNRPTSEHSRYLLSQRRVEKASLEATLAAIVSVTGPPRKIGRAWMTRLSPPLLTTALVWAASIPVLGGSWILLGPALLQVVLSVVPPVAMSFREAGRLRGEPPFDALLLLWGGWLLGTAVTFLAAALDPWLVIPIAVSSLGSLAIPWWWNRTHSAVSICHHFLVKDLKRVDGAIDDLTLASQAAEDPANPDGPPSYSQPEPEATPVVQALDPTQTTLPRPSLAVTAAVALGAVAGTYVVTRVIERFRLRSRVARVQAR